jgi:hypothetical protein
MLAMKNSFAGLVLGALVLLPFASSCGGGSGGGTATPTEFCHSLEAAACDKVFECVPPAQRDATFEGLFGKSAAECKSKSNQDCATAQTDCTSYNASLASQCVSEIKAISCTTFDGTTPASCDQACPMAAASK